MNRRHRAKKRRCPNHKTGLMTDIRFYHMQTSTLAQALPALLGKALEQGRRVLVRTPDEARAQALDESLWVARPDSFLPHGVKGDKFPEDQPVYLTDAAENPNKADVLILTNGVVADNIADYALCCDMFDGRDEEAVLAARKRWATYKEQGFTVTYWQQTETGWSQKA